MKKLNLSHNRIELIEANSFQNLQKLTILDLSYNRLLSIDNNLFNGLIKLNDLYLVNELNFQLNNKSFDHLESISKIYFNESIMLLNDSINVCFFINSITDFLFIIIIMFLILVVALPLFFICQKSLNRKPLSFKKINHDISSIALNDNQLNEQLSLALEETSTLKISSELPEAI